MAEKGLYKKAVDSWSEDVKFAPRAKENKMFEQNANDKVGARKKSQRKGTPRANHKHDYQPIIVWRKSIFNDNINSRIAYCCAVCGKIENSFSSYYGGNKAIKYLGELEHFWQNKQGELQPIDSKTYQKTIFLGGSKIIKGLKQEVISEIIDIMNVGHNIVIGDSMGADLIIQNLLAKNNYKNVTVYYSGDSPRINLGNWTTKHLSSNKFMSDYERQKLQGNQMAIDCDYGFMILKGMTKGTMANIEELIKLNKKCEVFVNKNKVSYPFKIITEKLEDIERIKWHYERFDKK